MTRRKLPIGVQTFRKVREEGCYYVDKTASILSLVDDGTHYFLSRPRRFGKSLLLDTMKELFEGQPTAVRGARRPRSVRLPVLRLDFGSGSHRQAGGLHEDVMAQLDDAAETAGVESRYDSAPVRFRHLIAALRRQAGQPVVVLVDEYDKPPGATWRSRWESAPARGCRVPRSAPRTPGGESRRPAGSSAGASRGGRLHSS